MTNEPIEASSSIPVGEFWRLKEQAHGLDRRLTEAERRQADRERTVDARFDRIEGKVEIIPTIRDQLEGLKSDVHDVATELHTFISASGVSRRGEWSLAGQVVGLAVSLLMMLIAAVSLVVAFAHRGLP